MFQKPDEQLADLDLAYRSFMVTGRKLSTKNLLTPLGDWTPRDILAHFIGWNRITLVGCAEICEGVVPFYFYDGTNDYRKVNASFFVRFPSTDQQILLNLIDSSMFALASYLKNIEEDEWERDFGIPHYRGGPATVARCVDSLIRDYQKHREEIVT